MSSRVWRCDVAEGSGRDGLGPCPRQSEYVLTWLDEEGALSTLKVCSECLSSARHSLWWDTPTVVELGVAPFAPGKVLA